MILIDNLTYQESKNKNEPSKYYTFWLRVRVEAGEFLAIAGWRYFPETRSLATPAIRKGDGKFFNTTKLSPRLYDAVKAMVEEAIGIEEIRNA